MTEFEDLRTRAEAGDAEAQTELGLMYADGRGVLQDDAEAVRWYRLAIALTLGGMIGDFLG